MPAGSNIVHEYFKKDLPGGKILLKVDPIRWTAIELNIPNEGEPSAQELELKEDFRSDLTAGGFNASSPLEFNLYDAGLIGQGSE
jgi:hypothetical protein